MRSAHRLRRSLPSPRPASSLLNLSVRRGAGLVRRGLPWSNGWCQRGRACRDLPGGGGRIRRGELLTLGVAVHAPRRWPIGFGGIELRRWEERGRYWDPTLLGDGSLTRLCSRTASDVASVNRSARAGPHRPEVTRHRTRDADGADERTRNALKAPVRRRHGLSGVELPLGSICDDDWVLRCNIRGCVRDHASE